MPILNLQQKDSFWLKDNKYSLYDMVNIKLLNENGINTEKIDKFIGGTLYQGFLNPWCYHKWHSPVKGRILATYKIPGVYYLQNPDIIDLQDCK